MPVVINQLFFIGLLLIVYNSKKDYFWFAIFFILISTPGSLFFGSLASETHRLPLYTIQSGLSISTIDLFLIITLIKALVKEKRNPMILKQAFTILGVLYIVVFFYSLLTGMSFDNIVRFSRNTLFFGLLISLPRLMRDSEDFYRFSHLVFPLVFIVLAGEFSQIFFNTRLIDYWVGSEDNVNFAVARGSRELFERPNLYGVTISLYSLIFSLYYISRKDYSGNRIYLALIAFASLLTAVLFQGRSWMSCFILILILSFIFVIKIKQKALRSIITGLIVISSAYLFFKPLTIAINNGIQRFSTVEKIAEGDLTAGGTNLRYTERLPQVMIGFKQSPAFGLGFSDSYWRYADYHVGFATMLLQIGIFGVIVFLGFWYRFYYIIYKIQKTLLNNSPLKDSILMFSIGLTGILLSHFTSYQFMGFEYSTPSDYYFICLFFVFADNQIKKVLQYHTISNF